MRSRGEGGTATITADTMAERFGVVHGTYTSVPLPQIRAHAVRPSPGQASKLQPGQRVAVHTPAGGNTHEHQAKTATHEPSVVSAWCSSSCRKQ